MFFLKKSPYMEWFGRQLQQVPSSWQQRYCHLYKCKWMNRLWPKEGKKLLPAGIVWPWILSLHPINIYKYKIKIYKYEKKIYKYEIKIYKHEIKIYKYEINIYKYETTFGMSFEFINDDY